jgi:hypothetical protein
LSILDKPCLASRAAFSDALDGQPLSWWRRLTVRVHRTTCPLCKPIWRSLEETKGALGALRDEEVDPASLEDK